MVSIFMCGVKGSGKTSLSDAILSKLTQKEKTFKHIQDVPNKTIEILQISNVDELNSSEYFNLQENILREQYDLEQQHSDSRIISDHSILDCLAHTNFYLGTEDFKRLYDKNRTEIENATDRYQSSLIILLSPPAQGVDKGYDDFIKVYTEHLKSLKIPYLKLCCTDNEDRINEVMKAIKGSSILDSSNLNNYSGKQKKDLSENQTTNFSFFIEKEKTHECICIPTIRIKEHEATQYWTIIPAGESNRFIESEKSALDHLVLIDFHITVRSTVVQKMLLNGITVNGKLYSFLGCSSKGLKNRKCFMWRGTQLQAEEILKQHGKFDQTSVSKQMARISLLFSNVVSTGINVKPEDIVDESDIIRQDKCFTDGCGGISVKLAKRVFSRIKARKINDGYLPSVYQIRLQGYKGVLMLDSTLAGHHSVKVRPSMKKFDTDKHPELTICEYSKPHTFGHLNKQFILLLSGLGVPDDIFLERQRIHFDMVENMGKDSEKTITILQWQNMFDLAQVIMNTTENTMTQFRCLKEVLKSVVSVQQKLVSKMEKLSILIPKSRNLFGVCDPTGTLDYGQCYLRITIGQHPKTITGQVVVIKNPCYLLGDVRVLEAVSSEHNHNMKPLDDLVDCIVFPTKGKRPHPDEIAGSDLDGDQFFVTWDETLVPKKMKEPYDYTSAISQQRGKITTETKIHYFSKQNEPTKLTGKINNFFLHWADLKGIESEECERLGILFSRNIDAAKTGETLTIPASLIPPKGINENEQKYVWQKMEEAARRFKQTFSERVIRNESDLMTADQIREEFVFDIVKQEFTNITEFQKFKFVWRYIENSINDPDAALTSFLETYVDFINFALFSNEEKREAFDVGIPKAIIENALHKSKILSNDDLASFNMQTAGTPWKYYFQSDHAEFDWTNLLKALTNNDCVLLILKLPDQVNITLQFLMKCTVGMEQPVRPGTITGYFHSKGFGYQRKYILGPDYFLDLSESTLQLYRECKKNLTFIWLKASDCKITKDSRKNEKPLCDELLYQVSVDLLRFNRQIFNPTKRHPLVNKIPFVNIEVFVQSKTSDVPYFDTIEANFLEPITETDDFEMDDEEDDTIKDFSEMMLESTCDPSVDEEERMTILVNASKKKHPLIFKNLLCLWGQNDQQIPSSSTGLFVSMLEGIVQTVCPYTVSEVVRQNIEEVSILLMSAEKLENPYQLLHLTELLFKLKLDDLASHIAEIRSSSIQIFDFLNLVTKWQHWWYLDQSVSTSFFNNITLVNDDHSDGALERYVYFYGKLQFLDLVWEFNSVKERFGSEKTDFSITNLKVERKEEFVYFYRSSALSHNPRITKSQFVAITRQRDFRRCPNYKSICCIAQVESIRYAPLTVTVKIMDEIPEIVEECFGSPKRILWRIDLLANITTHNRVMNALQKLLKDGMKSTPIVNFLINPGGHPTDSQLFQDKPFDVNNTQDFEEIEMGKAHLNSKQKEAIIRSLAQTVTLIQGPPGTGKTTVACEIIKTVYSTKKFQKILVVAETNIAVDNIAKKLRKDFLFHLLRMGNEGNIDTDIYNISLEGQLKMMEESDAMKTSFQDEHGNLHRKSQFAKKIINSSNILLTTCAGSGDPMLESYNFDFVLVDEATQVKETTLLCSLVKGAKRLVMIGDPKQLGPIVISHKFLQTSAVIPDVTCLSKTLFHRLDRVIPSCFLDTQYRMHNELMKYPSEQFYENRLKSAVSSDRKGIVFPWPDSKRPFCFVDISDGKERKVGRTFYNHKEVEAVHTVLDLLMNVGEENSDKRLDITEIGVLTPYQGQVMEISKTLHHQVEVRTVDGFQGREKEVVIVSCVRTNSNRSLDFVEDENRLNVMLTRAKRGLIIIGDELALLSSKLWELWLKEAPRLNLQTLYKPSQNKPSYQRRGGPSRGRSGMHQNASSNERAGSARNVPSRHSAGRGGSRMNNDREGSEILYDRRR